MTPGEGSTLRILHVSTRLILGGSQENTVLSCEGQARLGHGVHLAYGPIYGPEGSMLERVRTFRTDDGRSIAAHVVPGLVREVSPLKDLRARRGLESLVRRLEPDIVHTHSSKAGILGRLAAWSARRADGRPGVVHTIHGPPFMPVGGNALARARTRATNAMYTVAERRAARCCHVIVSVADAMTAQFLDRGIGREDQYITVRSGMETGPFLDPAPGETRREVRERLGIGPDAFVVGTVARLAQHKGHDDLLDAIGEEVRSRAGWRLLWVGDGWWRDRLMARVRTMGIEGRVVTTGLVEPGAIPGLMRAMDVLAHPSYREGLPRTVPQALLAGTLPVAYDADGTREVCRELETGRLVPVGDIDALRDAILWAHDDPESRARLVQRGREACSAEFDAGAMVQHLEEVYRRALAQV